VSAAQYSGFGPSRRGLRIRGLAVVVAAALVVTAAWWASQPDRSGEVQFAVTASNLGDGVSTDTAVRLRGISIGSVIEVEPQGPQQQIVTLSVDENRVDELSTAMHTRFVSSNIFGSTALELIPMPGGEPIRAGSTLALGDVGDYTVTTVLRDSGRLLLDVVTPQLSDSIDSAAELTQQMAPLLASSLLVMRNIARTQNEPLSELLPKFADVSEGVAAFTPSALNTLSAIASVEELEDDFRTQQASETITEVSHLVLALSGEIVGALGPTSSAVDMLLDILIPLNQSLGGVTPDQVDRLVDGADGALQHQGDRVVLGVDVLVDTFPAFRVPLETTGGTR